MNVIEIKNVSVRYRTGYKTTVAVNDVSLNIVENDYLCVVGDNGSGKSSLIKTIVGLNSPSTGKIKMNVKLNEISYLAQSTAISVDFPATVKEIVLCGTQTNDRIFPFYTKKDHEVVSSSMELLELTNMQNRRFGELSGGQQQRVLLARAICKKPKVLILDEPFAGLDIKISNSLYKILSYLNTKTNTTIVMVTHDQEEVKNFAKHVAVMDRSLLFYGTKEQWTSKRKRGDSI